MRKQLFLLLLVSALCRAQSGLFSPNDSLQAVTGLQWKYAPLLHVQDSVGIHFQAIAPHASERKLPFYDPKAVMPANPLMLDYRSGSYYVPRQVTNQLAQIMNRPSPDAFAPILAVAYLSARLALHALQIKKMVAIDTSAYLVEPETFRILQQLWKHSPQTAAQLFRHPELHASRTFTMLQADLNRLLDAKLVKIKRQEQAPPLYFPAQKGTVVRRMFNEALLRKQWNAQQQTKARRLLQMEWGQTN